MRFSRALHVYWGQLGEQVLLRRSFLHQHIPAFGHHVEGAIIQEDPKIALSANARETVTSRVAVSSPSDDLVLAEMPAQCSHPLADKAAKAAEQCRLTFWKGLTPLEKTMRLLSLCAYLQSAAVFQTLSRIEALQTGIPLLSVRAALAEQLKGIRSALLAECIGQSVDSARAARFVEKMKAEVATSDEKTRFVFPQSGSKGIVHLLYGSSAKAFTLAPVHWYITDLVAALHGRQTVLLTPFDAAPLSALYLSIAAHKAPLVTLESLFGESASAEKGTQETDRFAIPLGSVNVLHGRDNPIVEAVCKKYSGKERGEVLAQRLSREHSVASHFLVPNVRIRKHLERLLVSSVGENALRTTRVQVNGKKAEVSEIDTVATLPQWVIANQKPSENMEVAEAIKRVEVLKRKPVEYPFHNPNIPKQVFRAEDIAIPALYKALYNACIKSPKTAAISAFTALIQYIARRHIFGNNGYPIQRVPVICAPFAVQAAVCDALVEVLKNIRFTHACDDLHGDSSEEAIDGVHQGNDAKQAATALLYGPLHSAHDVHTLAEYIRSMQRSVSVEDGSILGGPWQLMAGGFKVPFPTGSFCAPAVLVLNIEMPSSLEKLQEEMNCFAKSTPEGPIVHLVCVKEAS